MTITKKERKNSVSQHACLCRPKNLRKFVGVILCRSLEIDWLQPQLDPRIQANIDDTMVQLSLYYLGMCYLNCGYDVLGSPRLISYQLRNPRGRRWPFIDGSNRTIPRGTMISLAWVMCTSLCLGMWTIPTDEISSLKERAFLAPK